MSKLLPMKQSSRRMRATRTQSTPFFPSYVGYIRYCSKVHGKVSAEVEEHIKQKLIAALFKFRFDR